MINSIKIELNRTIISNKDCIYYSNMIPHLLENSKNDDLLYRGIDLHERLLLVQIQIKRFLFQMLVIL